MSVYVDTMQVPLGRMVMCHMIADSTNELLAMADAIGVKRKWLQYPNTVNEHFDICLSKRAKAVALGAIQLTKRELAIKLRERRADARPVLGTPDGAKGE